jgi:hypothetical protein
MNLDTYFDNEREVRIMSILLRTQTSRRRSRRRARNLRTRVALGCGVLVYLVYLFWQPSATIKPEPASSPLRTSVLQELEPEQSADTEGALADWRQATTAALYVADR